MVKPLFPMMNERTKILDIDPELPRDYSPAELSLESAAVTPAANSKNYQPKKMTFGVGMNGDDAPKKVAIHTPEPKLVFPKNASTPKPFKSSVPMEDDNSGFRDLALNDSLQNGSSLEEKQKKGPTDSKTGAYSPKSIFSDDTYHDIRKGIEHDIQVKNRTAAPLFAASFSILGQHHDKIKDLDSREQQRVSLLITQVDFSKGNTIMDFAKDIIQKAQDLSSEIMKITIERTQLDVKNVKMGLEHLKKLSVELQENALTIGQTTTPSFFSNPFKSKIKTLDQIVSEINIAISLTKQEVAYLKQRLTEMKKDDSLKDLQNKTEIRHKELTLCKVAAQIKLLEVDAPLSASNSPFHMAHVEDIKINRQFMEDRIAQIELLQHSLLLNVPQIQQIQRNDVNLARGLDAFLGLALPQLERGCALVLEKIRSGTLKVADFQEALRQWQEQEQKITL